MNITMGDNSSLTLEQRSRVMLVTSIAYNVVLPSISAFGILGNVLNLATLRNSILQAVTYMYLRALCVADLGCMIFIIVFVLRLGHVLPGTDYSVAWYSAHLELPLINFFIAAGVLTIVALTVERYISVVWPVYFRQWNTAPRASTAIFLAYSFCFLLYIPMCWQKHVVCMEVQPVANNCLNWHAADDPEMTSLTGYVVYKWIREGVVRIIPIIALAYFNIHIIIRLRYVRKRRNRMLTSWKKDHSKETSSSGAGLAASTQKAPDRPQSERQAAKSRDEERLFVLLGGIVILFFFCNIPAAINLVFIKDAHKGSIEYQIFRATANLLEIANHAVNFYIFCMCSKDYRAVFIKTIPFLPVITQQMCKVLCPWCRGAKTGARGLGAARTGAITETETQWRTQNVTTVTKTIEESPRPLAHRNGRLPIEPKPSRGHQEPYNERTALLTNYAPCSNDPGVKTIPVGSDPASSSSGDRRKTSTTSPAPLGNYVSADDADQSPLSLIINVMNDTPPQIHQAKIVTVQEAAADGLPPATRPISRDSSGGLDSAGSIQSAASNYSLADEIFV